jgi:hypothetical protein
MAYNYQKLKDYCDEQKITLSKDYSKEKLMCKINIEGICITESCGKSFSIRFDCLIKGKHFCKDCTKKNALEKMAETNLKKYGSTCSLLNKDVKEKVEKTNIEKFGDKNPMKSADIRLKRDESNLEKYGHKNVFETDEVKLKSQNSSLLKYGTLFPMQDAEVSQKNLNSCFKSKEYKFPSGKIVKVQGYEPLGLDYLILKEKINEDDIFTNRTDIPKVYYKGTDGKQHVYFVDIFIKSQNRCIEIKSEYTFNKDKENVFLKQQALKDEGYECEIWVYNDKFEKVETYL